MMNAPTRFALLLALVFPAPLAFAQQAAPTITIFLKDGRAVPTATIKRSGGNVMVPVQVGNSTGEMGYSVANIARIDFPEPPEIKDARDLLGKGKIADVVKTLEPVLAAQQPFQDVQGNWWQEAAQVNLIALVTDSRDAEADALIAQLEKSSADPDILQLANVLQAASAARKGAHETSLPVFDAAIKQSKNRQTLANAWLNKGHCHFAMGQWEPAIMAYLRIPVFFADQKLLLPIAQLGSGRAMAGLGDTASATVKYNELIESFPSSAEASLAKSELEKLNNNPPNP